mgnify:CR=1 FL=1
MNARKVSSLRCPPYVLQDCFFASVCTRDSPHLQSVPVAVAHSDTDGSEISAANYAARAFGVRSGMWMKQARKLCPQLHVVPYQFQKFEEVSKQLYSILFSWSAQVQAVSCDEAFLDLSDAPDPESVVH